MAAQTNSSNPAPNIDIGNPYIPRRPAPIVSISINHPIVATIRKMKNFLTHKQTLFSTTFTIKITPIVALVSLMGVMAVFGGGITTAFQFGKTVEQKFLATTPRPSTKQHITTIVPISMSKAGTIKATYQLPVVTPTLTPFPSLSAIEGQDGSGSSQTQSTITPSTSSGNNSSQGSNYGSVLHYILVSKSGSITYLQSSTVNLHAYLGLRVLITGGFDAAKNILTISKSSDIEILQ